MASVKKTLVGASIPVFWRDVRYGYYLKILLVVAICFTIMSSDMSKKKKIDQNHKGGMEPWILLCKTPLTPRRV